MFAMPKGAKLFGIWLSRNVPGNAREPSVTWWKELSKTSIVPEWKFVA